MIRSTKTARMRALLALALSAVAVLALTGLATAKDSGSKRSDDGQKRHSHQPTGTIAAFDTDSGRLTVALTGGEEVSGLVTKRTRIRCEDERSHDSRVRFRDSGPGHDGDRDDNGSDDSGSGSEGSGQSGSDDNGRGANCTTADLVVGAVVDEAELDLKRGKAVFDEVELDD
jgi:hypothetical protein